MKNEYEAYSCNSVGTNVLLWFTLCLEELGWSNGILPSINKCNEAFFQIKQKQGKTRTFIDAKDAIDAKYLTGNKK